MNLHDAANFIRSQLITPSIDREISLIISHVLRIDSNTLPTLKQEDQLASQQEEALKSIVSRRLKEEPLELILGWTGFYGNKIYICPNVLIPRPETEQLVDIALSQIKNINNFPVNILEVGTGSGCIGVSVCKVLDQTSTQYNFLGIDISPDAVSCTINNFNKNPGNSQPQTSRRYDIVIQNMSLLEYANNPSIQVNILLSNPPYLNEQEMNTLPQSVGDFEPFTALSGGKDGMNVYREIYDFAMRQTNPPVVVLEISPTISKDLQKIFSENYNKVEILEDLFGRERFLVAQ